MELEISLNKLPKIFGNKKPKKRVGRGGGSGKGFHTTGRGNKGQKSRRGSSIPVGFEGGQVPLYRKMPSVKGFSSLYSKKRLTITSDKLSSFKSGETVSPLSLLEKGIIKKQDLKKQIKIVLGKNKVDRLELNFEGVLLSESVRNLAKNA